MFSRPTLRTALLPPCTCHRSLSTSTALLAPFRLARLPSRALLPIAGADSVKFLQGLISNDVSRLGQPSDPVTANGEPEIVRMLFAAILKADVSGSPGTSEVGDRSSPCLGRRGGS